MWVHFWGYCYMEGCYCQQKHETFQLKVTPFITCTLLTHTHGFGGGLPYCSSSLWLSKISPPIYALSVTSVIPLSSGASLWHQFAYLATYWALTRPSCLKDLSNFTTRLWMLWKATFQLLIYQVHVPSQKCMPGNFHLMWFSVTVARQVDLQETPVCLIPSVLDSLSNNN